MLALEKLFFTTFFYNGAKSENFLGNIRTIFLINQAQIQYLQDEYSSILVNSQFNSMTSKIVQALQKLSPALWRRFGQWLPYQRWPNPLSTRQCTGFSNRGYYRGGSREGYKSVGPDQTRQIISRALPKEYLTTVRRTRPYFPSI